MRNVIRHILLTLSLILGISGTKAESIAFSPTKKEAVQLEETERDESNEDDGDEIIRKEIERLEKLKENSSPEDKEKLSSLIDVAEDFLPKSNEQGINVVDGIPDGVRSNPTLYGIFVYFAGAGYFLAEELYLHSFEKGVDKYTYTPVQYGVAAGSPIVKQIADGTSTSGSSTFTKDSNDGNASVVACDLRYAIQSFNYSKPNSSSKIVTIDDTYDYVPPEKNSKLTEQEKEAILACIQAHAAGIMTYYPVSLTIDMSKVLYPKLYSYEDDSFFIRVDNNTAEDQYIVYNEKLVSQSDALTWNNMNNISNLLCVSGGSIYFSMNFTGEHYLAISYFYSTNSRYETIVHYYPAGYIDFTFNIGYCPYSNDCINVGKKGNKWLIGIMNASYTKKTLEYNAKMCNEGDATNWQNLKDIKETTLNAMQRKFIYVEENYFATHIAVRLLTDTVERRFAINELDSVGNVTAKISVYGYYPSLQLSNLGKTSGKWSIKVTNPLSQSTIVYYNTKMCYDDDAKEWKNLKDVSSFSLSSGASKTVTVSENWFATTIAFSYVNTSGTRVITYANSLGTDGTMAVMSSHL